MGFCILVTGGSGYLGQHLCAFLSNQGHKVRTGFPPFSYFFLPSTHLYPPTPQPNNLICAPNSLVSPYN